MRMNERSVWCEECTVQDAVGTGRKKGGERETLSFLACVDSVLEQLRLAGKFGTERNLRSARNSLERFLDGRPLMLDGVTVDVINRYERWLHSRGMTRNSSSFYMRQLRMVYYRWTKKWGGRQGTPFREVYLGIDRTRKRAVDASLIREMMQVDFTRDRSLAWARDLFVLSFCLRGMAFVDMAFLTKKNIHRDILRYKRRKTAAVLEVYMEPYVRLMLKRYEPYVRGTPYLLPILTEEHPQKAYLQYMNRLSYYNKLLKRLSVYLHLEIPLTSYVARHTWATTAHHMNIALPVISAAMGHSSEVTTQIYLASIEASAIDKANRQLLEALALPVF